MSISTIMKNYKFQLVSHCTFVERELSEEKARDMSGEYRDIKKN